jgi:hypothetical protein
MPASSRRLASALLAIGAMGCVELGFSNRVLWRVPSPDGKMVAACQEIPELDGPGYDIRLEGPDGTFVKQLYRIGDGDPCSEMAWSPDGRTLAVLSGHVARVRFVDVAWALQQTGETRYWSWPQIDLGSERLHRDAGALRFTGPREIELRVCGPQAYTPRDSGRRTCPANSETRRIAVPERR